MLQYTIPNTVSSSPRIVTPEPERRSSTPVLPQKDALDALDLPFMSMDDSDALLSKKKFSPHFPRKILALMHTPKIDTSKLNAPKEDKTLNAKKPGSVPKRILRRKGGRPTPAVLTRKKSLEP